MPGRPARPIEGARLRDHCEDDHEFGYQLMRRFASVVQQRLQRTRMELLDVYGSARAIR
ncbi:MAG: hypothetical protein ACLP01_22110 [Solirubrobacteraceae bacterium]